MSIDWFPDEGWQRLQSQPEAIAFTVVFAIVYCAGWIALCIWLNRRAR